MTFGRLAAVGCACLLATLPVQASLGPYEHGGGIKSQGAGGIVYAHAEESTVIAFNPAAAAALDRRSDLGVSLFIPTPTGEFRGNLFGADQRYDSDGQKIYPIPQGGLVRHLAGNWSLGIALASAGLGPDYTHSPYERFGGARRSSLTLVSSGAVVALAWRPHADHALGLSLNPGYQIVNITGLEFIAEPFGLNLPASLLQVSETPRRATNQGSDGVPTFGASIGWHGLITPYLAAGLAYRTKTWAARHREYRGVIPDRGRLELPAIWGGGIAYMPARWITLAFDYQRYELNNERALANRIERLGHLLGSKHGPGFGLRDLNAYKFGVTWLAMPRLTLRAGYIEANRPTRASETLFNILASVNTTTHYTGGFTWTFEGWELSAHVAYAPEQRVEGRNSVPLIFGEGEASHEFGATIYGLSVGWGFGR
jgi:long-chain fatty acid transport protein